MSIFDKIKKSHEKYKADAPKRQAAKLSSIKEKTKLFKAQAALEKQKAALNKVKAVNQPAPPVSFGGSFDTPRKKRKPEQYGSNFDF